MSEATTQTLTSHPGSHECWWSRFQWRTAAARRSGSAWAQRRASSSRAAPAGRLHSVSATQLCSPHCAGLNAMQASGRMGMHSRSARTARTSSLAPDKEQATKNREASPFWESHLDDATQGAVKRQARGWQPPDQRSNARQGVGSHLTNNHPCSLTWMMPSKGWKANPAKGDSVCSLLYLWWMLCSSLQHTRRQVLKQEELMSLSSLQRPAAQQGAAAHPVRLLSVTMCSIAACRDTWPYFRHTSGLRLE